MFDIASGNSLFSTEGSSLAYSPDGRWLAGLAADEKTVLLLDARTHETTARFSGHEQGVFKAAFSPDSRLLATCSSDHTVRLWQIGNVEREGLAPPLTSALDLPPSQVLRGHTDQVFAVAFHPDGTRLATAGRDGAVWLWDLARGEDGGAAARAQELRLVAGLQPRRRDAGVGLRRRHGSTVGYRAA